VLQRISGVTITRYINLHFTYLLTYLVRPVSSLVRPKAASYQWVYLSVTTMISFDGNVVGLLSCFRSSWSLIICILATS